MNTERVAELLGLHAELEQAGDTLYVLCVGEWDKTGAEVTRWQRAKAALDAFRDACEEQPAVARVCATCHFGYCVMTAERVFECQTNGGFANRHPMPFGCVDWEQMPPKETP